MNRGVSRLERLSYDEAREWFWVRTLIWLLPAAVASVISFYGFAGWIFTNELVKAGLSQVWLSVGGSALVLGFGLAAAYISLQLPWMRAGWRYGFVLNGPVCAAISALAAFLACGMILSFLQNEPPNQFEQPVAFARYIAMIDVSYVMMRFGIGAAAFWGFIFGSWFAMRRDKYFVELI